jgi:GT2 family glycosyltransferase
MRTVSVVVPVLNAARTLTATLGALARLSPPPLEMLLVDNGSADGSRELLEAFVTTGAGGEARLLEEPRRGASAARNAGIRAARGEVVAFTDADCLPDAAWLEHLAVPFADPTVGAAAGRVMGAPAESILELFSALYTLRSPETPARHARWTPWDGGFPTANLAVRRRLLDAVGGFDETLPFYGEDYDLCAALYARGATIAYTPAARVLHRHRTTLRGLARQANGFGRVHAVLLRRHAPMGLWIELPRRSVHWGGMPVRCWIDLAAPEKKLLAILAAGIGSPLLLGLAPVYLAWLAHSARRRAWNAGTTVSRMESLELASLLLLKSAALTTGRWWGSIRYGACCL